MHTLPTLLELAVQHNPDTDANLIRDAYEFSEKAHSGQKRLSGDPYFNHCVEVAKILASLRLDSTTVAAGLLHDVIEDTAYEPNVLEQKFGAEIVRLVQGVTKMGSIGFKTSEEYHAENLRKMLVAMAEDIRVILIKLADRVHNMRTVQFLPPDTARRICQETLDIYAPLAHRLGIARIKWELEDLAFGYLYPEAYRDLVNRVVQKRREREKFVADTAEFLKEKLAAAGVQATISGRPKHFYSIFVKMRDQGKEFEEVLDLLALRVVTLSVKDCYAALGIIHSLWKPIPGRFKDYVAVPKSNLYQSLHTTVMRETGEPLEIQIRTEEMHRTAEEGIAAHWKYKESKGRSLPNLDKRLLWLRQMFEWLQDLKEPREFMENLKTDLFTSEVYVFTPKGEIKELPYGSTPIDFAYAVHSAVGNHCYMAKVNGKVVSLRYNLRQGDVVEIITSEKQRPMASWLEVVKTSKARNRIRHALRGKIETSPAETKEHIKRQQGTDRKVFFAPSPSRPVLPTALKEEKLWVQGQEGVALRFAKCCDPLPGEEIVGYVTKDRGISIHRKGCPSIQFAGTQPARFIDVSWKGDPRSFFLAGLRVKTVDRPHLLMDILNIFGAQKINIYSAQAFPPADGHGVCEIVAEIREQKQLAQLLSAVKRVNGVLSVHQFPPVQSSPTEQKKAQQM